MILFRSIKKPPLVNIIPLIRAEIVAISLKRYPIELNNVLKKPSLNKPKRKRMKTIIVAKIVSRTDFFIFRLNIPMTRQLSNKVP